MRQSAINMDITIADDGWNIAAGASDISLGLTSGDVSLIGDGNGYQFDFPGHDDNLVGATASQTLFNKIYSGGTVTSTISGSSLVDSLMTGGTITNSLIRGGTIDSALITGSSIVNPRLAWTTDKPRMSLWLSGAGGWPSSTNGCSTATAVEMATNKQTFYAMHFAGDAAKSAEWTIAMPDNWNAGNLYAKFYWSSSSGTPGQHAVFGMQSRSYGDNDALDATWGLTSGTSDTLLATNDMHISPETGGLTAPGAAAGELVQFRCTRYTADAQDNMTEAAYLIGVKLEYKIDTFRS